MKHRTKLNQWSKANIIKGLPMIGLFIVIIFTIGFFGLTYWKAMGFILLIMLTLTFILNRKTSLKQYGKQILTFGIFVSIIWVLIQLVGGWGFWGFVIITLIVGGYVLYKRWSVLDEGTDMIVATIKEAMEKNENTKKHKKNSRRIKQKSR